MSRPLRRSWGERFVLSINVVSIVAALLVAWVLRTGYGHTADVERVELAGTLTVSDDAEEGQQVLNFLLVGYDSSAGLDPDDPIQEGRQGERFADAIIIAHIDQRDGTAALLSIPRDLWVPIAGENREQKINFAYSVGGPATLIDTIEEQFDIPIHHYASVDFAGFQGLVEAVGTVDVYFERPARDWNANPTVGPPRSQTGFEQLEAGCHALDPETALAYVRSRYYQVLGDDGRWVNSQPTSDLGRMIRQQRFLQSLLQRAIDRGARNPLVLNDLIDTGFDNVTIDQDLTLDLLLGVGRTFSSFEPEELQTYSYPNRFGSVGSVSVLFGLDEEAEPVLRLFRGIDPDDPRTVRVKVVNNPSLDDNASEVADELAQLGFIVESPSGADVGPGLTIRHGRDGAQAAQVLAAELAGSETVRARAADTTIEQVDGLDGRDVVLTLGPEAEAGEAVASPTTTPDVAAGESATTSGGQEPLDVAESPASPPELCR